MTLAELNDIVRDLYQWADLETVVDSNGVWSVVGVAATDADDRPLIDGLPSQPLAEAWIRYLCDEWVSRQVVAS